MLAGFATILTPAGQVLARLGRDLITPVKVVLDPQGDLWVTEHRVHRVAEVSAAGAVIRRLGGAGSGPGRFDHPNGITLNADGNLLVADHFNNRVQELTSAGDMRAQWSVSLPFDVAVDTSSNVYVSTGGSVEKLSPSGALLARFGPLGDARGVALDAADNLYVGDAVAGKVIEFSPAGAVLGSYGTGLGTSRGAVNLPADVAVDAFGNVYVAEGDPEDGTTCTCRVQKFSPRGEVLAVWR